jgi:hypothetical protein
VSATDHERAARDVMKTLRDLIWNKNASAATRKLGESVFNRNMPGTVLARILESAHAAHLQARN